MATPLHTIEDVAEAIECVSAERLRIVLQDVIMKSPEACALLRSELIVQPKPKTQSQSQSGPRKRRKQETFQHRYERCKKYYQEYEITANSQEACTYHKGDMNRVWSLKNGPEEREADSHAERNSYQYL